MNLTTIVSLFLLRYCFPRNRPINDVSFLLLLLEVHRYKQIKNPTKTDGEVSIQIMNNN